ncbi:unnamed protein product [Protopolystoma xenopodis]|uniref:G-protein coupled receptors family 1 profile domain-containing protein n=1 Tax=Protopolystoma xenopodis TaxID=117903 RepID=A0A3S5BSM9_9PLAT|nr:unnamed protein product [Protopolystoma xenopodis]
MPAFMNHSSTPAAQNDPLCAGCELIFEPNPWKALPILAIGIISLFGNAGVIAVILTNRSLQPIRHSSNQALFMLSLGISDFGSAVCFLLFSARYALQGHGPASGTELDLGAGISYCLLTASLFSTLGIGLDKLAHIETPYSYDRLWTRRRCATLVLGYWVLLATLSILPTQLVPIPHYYYQFNLDTLTFVTQHEAKFSALLVVRFCMFAALLLTLGIGYGRLYCIMRQFATRPPASASTSHTASSGQIQSEKRCNLMQTLLTCEPSGLSGSESARLNGAQARNGTVACSRKHDGVHYGCEGLCESENGDPAGTAAIGGPVGRGMLRGTKTICLVLGSFILVWLPFFIVHIAMASKRIESEDVFNVSRELNHSDNHKTGATPLNVSLNDKTGSDWIGDEFRLESNLTTSIKPVWMRRLDFALIWFAMLHTCLNIAIYSGTYRPFRKGLVNLIFPRKRYSVSGGGMISGLAGRRQGSLLNKTGMHQRQSNTLLLAALDGNNLGSPLAGSKRQEGGQLEFIDKNEIDNAVLLVKKDAKSEPIRVDLR